jgi:hypothetical protein
VSTGTDTAVQQAFADLDFAGPIITADEARGNSRPVTRTEFDDLAATGRAMVHARMSSRTPATGLDERWDTIVADAFRAVSQPWGGVTVDTHTGQPIQSDADLYALSFRPQGVASVSTPEDPTLAEFAAAMAAARTRFRVQLEATGAHLGVFHDDDMGRVDIDPVLIVDTVDEVEAIGAYTHAVGGAYHFRTGDGFWPPHVAATVTV